MNVWRVARVGTRALTLVVVAVSGIYLLVYLYRWEWNRALISGMFFVAALVTFSTSMVLAALRRLDERIDRLEAGARSGPEVERGTRQAIARANDAHATSRFDWLREPTGGFGVFVPVLLGTGVLLSALTYVIERAASVFASTTVDRKTARLLAPDLPLGSTPLDVGPRSQVDEPATPQERAYHLLGWAVVIAVGSLLTVAAINLLAEATQSRDEASDVTGTTQIELAIDQRGRDRSPETVASALWTACEHTLRVDATLVETQMLSGNHVQLTLDGGLGELARRRLFGCLEDATLDLVRASVRDYEIHHS
jgi:hypothetical protein